LAERFFKFAGGGVYSWGIVGSGSVVHRQLQHDHKKYTSTAQSGKQTGTAAPPVHQKPKHTDIISLPRAPLSLLLYPDPKLDSLALARE